MRTLVITDADHQRLESELWGELLVARRERVVFERRLNELEQECQQLRDEIGGVRAHLDASSAMTLLAQEADDG